MRKSMRSLGWTALLAAVIAFGFSGCGDDFDAFDYSKGGSTKSIPPQ